MFVLTWLSLEYIFGTVRVLGSTSPVLRVPLYLVYLAAPIGFVLAGVQYALAFLKNLTSEGVYLSFDHEDTYDEPPAGGA
jgi:TRAP-type C4-dicarboxylate transport system permease small subunit